MRTVGVVVEYNPMHNGHVYHIQKSIEIAEAEAVVAVMSGQFLQRGEPAIVDKWTRTQMALANGVDLVIELPVVYSTQSARLFAFGAVCLLDALKVVDAICFGSERGELEPLLQMRDLLLDPPDRLHHQISTQLEGGFTYPRAHAQAVREYLASSDEADPSVLDTPNNMLGLEYLRALHVVTSHIRPYTIQRIAAGYHDETLDHPHIASATAIRKAVSEQHDISTYMPKRNALLLEAAFQAGRGPVTWNSYNQLLFGLLQRSDPGQLTAFIQIDDSLAHRLIDASRSTENVLELVAAVKTKRYTWTRIQRALTAILLGFTQDAANSLQIENGPSYIRVLGFTEKGRALLRKASSLSSLPIITSLSRNTPPMLEWDLRATRLHVLGRSHFTAQDFHEDVRQRVLRQS